MDLRIVFGGFIRDMYNICIYIYSMVANDQYNSWDDLLVDLIYHDYQYNINTHQYQSLYDTISW
jgi:hypothetical protein